MAPRDDQVKRFWPWLKARMAERGQPPIVRLYFLRRPELHVDVEVIDGKAMVRMTPALIERAKRVELGLVRKSLDKERLGSFEGAWKDVLNEPIVSPNRIMTGLLGPLVSPTRGAQEYSAGDSFFFEGAELERALGNRPGEPDGTGYFSLKSVAGATVGGSVTPISKVSSPDETEDETESEPPTPGDERLDRITRTRNLIVFGPPGTGKSHLISRATSRLDVAAARTFRVTFHPEYSYHDFVGAFRPVVGWLTKDGNCHSTRPQGPAEPRTYYDFVPGPFSLALQAASKSPADKVALVIEEINRGNCAAIFGDVFQLLDRHETNDAEDELGWSEYPIAVAGDWGNWLESHCDADSKVYTKNPGGGRLRIPANLHIFATMNTSDQSLFPLDTAFRRRWAMEYVPIEQGSGPKGALVPLSAHAESKVAWSKFYEVINGHIVEHTRSDDKQMGPWFVKTASEDTVSLTEFSSKVLFYLWNDVFRESRARIFDGQIRTYDHLVRDYLGSKQIFSPKVLEELGANVAQP